MANEEIKIKLGLDSTPLSRALTGVIGSVKRSLSGIGGQIAAGLGLSLGVGGVFAGIRKAIQLADQLKTTSESLNVSTDFLQGFQRFAQDNGGSVEMANKALEKLSRLAGDALAGDDGAIKLFKEFNVALINSNGTFKDSGELALAVADRLKDAKSGAEQTNISFQLMGKGAVAMAAGMKQGSAALQEYIDKSPKISKQQINALDELGDSIQRAGANAVIVTAEVSSALGMMAEAWTRSRREGISAGEAAAAMRKEMAMADEADEKKRLRLLRDETAAIMERDKKAEEKAKMLSDAAEVKAKWAAENAMSEASIAAAMAAQIDRMRALGELGKSRGDRGRFTLGELADLETPGGLLPEQAKNKGLAKRARELIQQGRMNIAAGREKEAKKRFAAADAITAQLSPLLESERNPEGAMQKVLDDSNMKLTEILTELSERGIIVRSLITSD